MKKILALLAVCAAALASVFTFVSCGGIEDNCPYVLDESGHHVANIDLSAYIDAPEVPQNAYDIRDFGASVDASSAANAAAINSALQRASENGGTVLVADGDYSTDTVHMQSGVTLYIAEGSSLSVPAYDDLDVSAMDTALVKAVGADGWTITGGGTLNGRGTEYTEEADDPSVFYPLETFELKEYVLEMRSRIRDRKSVGYNVIYAQNCNDVTLSSFVIRESSTWTVNLTACDGVAVSGVVIDNNIHVANSDGIDICGSSNVAVENCFIATGDDGIVLKSSVGEINNVTVKNCEIMSLANNFKIGTETGHDVSGVEVSDCYFFTAQTAGGYAGIAIESADGADISDVSISDVEMDNVTAPLLIWLGCRLDEDNGSDGSVGSVNGVTLRNISATNINIGSAIVGCEYGGAVHNVQNVTIDGFTASYRNCKAELDIYRNDQVLDANMNGYPEITRVSHRYLISHELSEYYDMPYYGLYADKVEGLTVNGFSVVPRDGETRPLHNLP